MNFIFVMKEDTTKLKFSCPKVRFFYLYLYKYEYVKKILFIYFIYIFYIGYNCLYHDHTFCSRITFLYFNYIFYISIIFFVLQSCFSVFKSQFFLCLHYSYFSTLILVTIIFVLWYLSHICHSLIVFFVS